MSSPSVICHFCVSAEKRSGLLVNLFFRNFGLVVSASHALIFSSGVNHPYSGKASESYRFDFCLYAILCPSMPRRAQVNLDRWLLNPNPRPTPEQIPPVLSLTPLPLKALWRVCQETESHCGCWICRWYFTVSLSPYLTPCKVNYPAGTFCLAPSPFAFRGNVMI